MVESSLSLVIGAEYAKKNETRTALTPRGARSLIDRGFCVSVQSWDQRVFSDDDYRALGVPVVQTFYGAGMVVKTKEYHSDWLRERVTHGLVAMAFHHCHKGQPYNLANLKIALEQEATLVDYELLRLPDGRQPMTTSVFAGMAGAFNALSVFGQRQVLRGEKSVFGALPKPGLYGSTEALRGLLAQLGSIIEDVRILVVGTGCCGQGAAEVCSWLGIPQLKPSEVLAGAQAPKGPWYSVLGTADTVRRIGGGRYNKAEYREQGCGAYESCFEDFLGRHNVLVFCPYWDERYPKLLPRELIAAREQDLPLVISDVTCDLDGSLGCTLQETTINEPVCMFSPHTGKTINGLCADGVCLTAVDNLPSQIAKSCSEFMSQAISEMIPPILSMDLRKPMHLSGLPDYYLPGFITWRGELTEPYKGLSKLLA